MIIAFQGEKGAYSQIASLKKFSRAKTKGYRTFEEVFKAVEKEEVNYGIIPLENSTTGSIVENYDLLLKYNLYIRGEIFLKIKHCLLATTKLKLKDIKEVYSHPQALEQCKEFLEKNNLKAISSFDTAGSVEVIKNQRDKAIIASQLVAKLYHLKILKKNISLKNNITRFIFISKKEFQGKEKGMKTSLIFRIKHKPGTLVDALIGFKEEKVNLLKIESRPIKNKPWEYSFYLDFSGEKNEERVKKALKGLKSQAIFLKILGSYPQG